MQNQHDDKNLDRLSREAADEFQPDLSLHSWERLKAGLDKELPEKREKKRRFIFILFFFLLVGGGIVLSALWFNRDKAPQQAGIPAEAGNKTSGTVAATPPAAQPQSNATATTVDKPAAEENIVSDKSTVDKASTGKSVDKTQAPVAVTTADSRNHHPEQTDMPVNKGRNKETARKNNSVKNPVVKQTAISTLKKDADKDVTNDVTKDASKNPASDIAKDDTKDADNKTDASKQQPAATDNKNVTDDKTVKDDKTVTDNKTVTAETKTDNKTTSTTDQPSATEDKPQTTNKKLKTPSTGPSVAASRWEFGAAYAPDVSTVKFTHTQKPGINLGLTIGYNISRRFAVQAGAIYTKKNYKSRGEDYHPPKGYWTEYVKIETVAADCNMWDIPINLRYNLVPKHRSNLFITTGLSSYFMRKEDYDFFYYYNGTPMNRYRSYETDNKHWLSVLNFSVGYEHQVSRNFSIQAEPFFKQPLKGLGFGNVKLNSTGIFFSVKYKPVAKSRK